MELYNGVYSILEELSGETSISASHSISEDLSLDSLKMVTLLLNIEETFGFRLKPEDMNPYKLVIVNDVIELVKKYTDGKQ